MQYQVMLIALLVTTTIASYDKDGRVASKLYDANYRATDVVAGALNLHFRRSALGDIVAEGDTPGAATPNESYVYDPLDRLQQVEDASGAPWQSYTYDKTGDRLGKVIAGVGTDDYSYTPGTHHLIGIGGYDSSSRAMDANGNTTALAANGWMYGLGYDATGRLVLVQQGGTTMMRYRINGRGERVRKQPVGGGMATDFVHDGAGRLIAEYTANTRRDYVWADGTLVAILDSPAPAGDAIHYVYTDQLGTPRAVTTQSGTLVWDWPYTQNPFGERPASGNGYTLNLRYPGQYFDQETGLNYNYLNP